MAAEKNNENETEKAVVEEPVENGENTEQTENADSTDSAETGEKKENAFSKFWKKTKQSVNDSILEAKIRSAFEHEHNLYSIYAKNELLPTGVIGSIAEGVLTVFGEVSVKNWSVVVSDDDEKAYYVLSSNPTTVTATVEGVSYERSGTAIFLDENVEEVNVVKAGKRYFIYKGPIKK